MIFLLAVRNLMKQKQRSIVCLLAILLSVGMMTCVGQVIETMKKSNIKDMEAVMGKEHITVRANGLLLFTNEESVKLFGDRTTLFIRLQDTKGIRPLAEKLTNILGSDAVSLNTDLFRVLNAVKENISLIVIYAFIIVTSVLCLYNIFQISLLERIRQLGMLRCMGMCNLELFEMLIVEGLLLGGIGIPSGVLLGIWISKAACSMVLSMKANAYEIAAIDIQNIVLAIGLGIMIIMLCTLKSVLQLKKLSPMDAMRMVGNTKVIKKGGYHFSLKKH